MNRKGQFCYGFVIILLGITGHECCWGRSSTPKPVATTSRPEVEEIIKATNVQGAKHGRTRGGGSHGQTRNIGTAELKSLSEELYKLEKSSGSLDTPVHNLQGKTTSKDSNDKAKAHLFTDKVVIPRKKTTVSLFNDLLDNYEASTNVKETTTNTERTETDAFLNAVVNTAVMKELEQFLKKKGLIQRPLRTELKELWFTPYSRSGRVLGSSGFEHVFLGEIKPSEVTGFHNWIFFAKEEKENKLDYKGYIKTVDIDSKRKIIKMRFNWLKKAKNYGSMFVGTTPEFEMALYTLCFYTRKGKNCNLQLNNKKVGIKVYDHHSKNIIGSAFPQVY